MGRDQKSECEPRIEVILKMQVRLGVQSERDVGRWGRVDVNQGGGGAWGM